MNWDDIRFFLAAARAQSFAGAARAIEVEHTTVARRVAALEKRLGTRLFHRGTGGLRLTDAGEEVVSRAERAESTMLDVERLAGTFDSEPAGQVVLATSSVLAESFVVPALASLTEAHPRIALELAISRRFTNLPNRDADVAFRLRPEDVSVAELDVIASKAATIDFGLYASSEYLASRPAPSEAPAEHRVIRYGTTPWEPGGRVVGERLAGATTALVVDDMFAVRRACAAGFGLAVLPRFFATPELQRLEGSWDRAGLYVVVHPDLQRTSRVRAVVRWLKDSVAARLAEIS